MLPAADDGDAVVAPLVPVAVVLLVADDPDADEDELDAFVRTKLASAEVAPVVPLVPVAPEVALLPRWMHPVTVI